jgi:hypothetical protein
MGSLPAFGAASASCIVVLTPSCESSHFTHDDAAPAPPRFMLLCASASGCLSLFIAMRMPVLCHHLALANHRCRRC